MPSLSSPAKPNNQSSRSGWTLRITELDSLRGVAALTVVFYHGRCAFNPHEPAWYLRPFFAGHEAVILFFVLSGYVLSLPAWTQRTSAYPEYLIRRFSRIYLPYLAAAALSALGCWVFLGSRLPLTPWFYKTWQTPFSTHLVIQQILMSTEPVWNTAFWSLRYEMEMSIVFPFLCWLISRTGRHSGVLLTCLLIGIAGFTNKGNLSGNSVALGFYYAIFFVAGAALARERGALENLLNRLPGWALWCALWLSLAVYWEAAAVPRLSQREIDLSIMLGACGLIQLVQQPRLRLGLRAAPAEYLGKISYSLYLVHGTVLFTELNLLYGRVPLPVLILIYIGSALVVADLFHRLVEDPSLHLGKRIARLMQKKKAA
ncbi:acyltransferase family protein [Edaphobacter flagellatus]|uniref:acyltransferase family protein n=1 Tax=Edaphobacter flagellatus TaxID=1933044 RepID=UPI0021B2EE31|nr:acyltransferase [Edaphobacter flagellatus]